MKTFLKIYLILIALFVLGLVTVNAQAISIKVQPRWSAVSSLTSLDTVGGTYPTHNAGDDYRYLGVDVNVTLNVEFWAVQMTCNQSANLEIFASDSDNSATPDDYGDWDAYYAGSAAFGSYGDDFTMVREVLSPTSQKITISRLGQVTPVGANGQETTHTLVTFNYRVKPQAGIYNNTGTFTCTGITFLNRNGQTVGTAIFTAPAPVGISTGFSLSGKVLYQGRAAHAGIGVVCTENDTPTSYTTRTGADGSYTINNLRLQTWYGCDYFGQNITNEIAPAVPVNNADVYLPVTQWYNFGNGMNYKHYPVILPLGNSNRTSPSIEVYEQTIDNDDLADITANWNNTNLTAYQAGDVNGDKKVDRTDLVFTTGNYGLGYYLPANHLVLSAQRQNSTIYPDNRLWLNNNVYTGWGVADLRQLITGSNRDYWPAVSPDGTKIVFSRAMTTGTGASATTFYALFVTNADGTGVPLRLTPLTPAWGQDAFAPSWSPDGSRIAFVCSYTNGQDYRQAYDNAGSLCVVDANGRNLQTLTYGTKIYPPEWISSTEILFGGTSWNWACPDSICILSTFGGQQLFDNDLFTSGGSNFADMPQVRFGRIYYRYQTDLYDSTLRIASVINGDFWSGNPLEDFNASPIASDDFDIDGEYHTELTQVYYDELMQSFYAPMSENVEYYRLTKHSDQILFYEYYWDGSNYSSENWHLLYAEIDWTENQFVGNLPLYTLPNSTYLNAWSNPWWDGDLNSGTWLYPHRMTFDFVQ